MRRLVVLGNVSVDTVDRGPPRPGGCPSFAAPALRRLGFGGTVVTRFAEADRGLFEPFLDSFGVELTYLRAAATARFELRYVGDRRDMTIRAIGDEWSVTDVTLAGGEGDWLHVAPLLRSDFPPETLAALAAGGRKVSLDGQGLVRIACLGPLRLDRAFDPAALRHLRVLKLSEEEAQVVAGGRFHAGVAEDLGVPETLVTLGAEGAEVYAEGGIVRVPAAGPVLGVETTGAGDVFMVAYCAARSDGAQPVEAARSGVALVAEVLERRLGTG